MEIKKLETSVIIIGAGPAGAATSFFLTKFAIPHIVLEKETFPRDKVCGDACSGKTALVIKRANPLWLTEILEDTKGYLPSWGIRFVAPNGKPIDIPFNPNRTPASLAPGFTVPRLVFDNFLFRKMASSYCTIYQNAVVENMMVVDGKNIVTFTHLQHQYQITAPIIVGADGDKSIVRKKYINEQSNSKSYAIGLRAYYQGVTELHPENFIELHFLKEVLPGYLWIFPLPNGMVNVGVGIMSDVVRKKKINLREQMLKAINNNPGIANRFTNAKLIGNIQGWGLPLATKQKPISGDNFLLTGDAGGLVDPFTGEGIGNAMYSGMLAAEAVKEAILNNDFSLNFFKNNYDYVFYKRLGDELKISTTMQKMSKYKWVFNFVINKAYKSASLRNTISCMFTDIDLRSRLKKPLFYLKILFNK